MYFWLEVQLIIYRFLFQNQSEDELLITLHKSHTILTLLAGTCGFTQKSCSVRVSFPNRGLLLSHSEQLRAVILKHRGIKTRNDPIFNPTLTETSGQRCIAGIVGTFRKMSKRVGASDAAPQTQRVVDCVPAIVLPLFNRFGSQTGPSGGAVHGHQVHQRRVPEQPGPSGQRLSRRGYGPPSAATLPLLPT